MSLAVTGFVAGATPLQAQDIFPEDSTEDKPELVARDVEPRLINAEEMRALLADNYPPRLRRDRISSSVTLYIFDIRWRKRECRESGDVREER